MGTFQIQIVTHGLDVDFSTPILMPEAWFQCSSVGRQWDLSEVEVS